MPPMRPDSKPTMYQFTELQQAEPLYNTVEFLSIISTSPHTLSRLQHIAEQFYLYRHNNFSQVGDLVKFITDTDCKHFAVEAKAGNDSLAINSSEKEFLNLDLSEHTLSQNNYASRCMRFTKVVPAKSSPNYETRYTCKVKMDSNAKYYKDLLCLISKAFSNARIQVLLEIELPFDLQRISPNYKQVELSPNSNLEALNYKKIDREDSMEYYEYFCMLHINGFPDRSSDHVQLTSMYEGPKIDAEQKYELPLYLTVANDVNPSIMAFLADEGDWISLFARTKNQNVLMAKSQTSYKWRITY